MPARPIHVVLDACVIYPSVLRAILLRLARAGLYQPLWSARILEEWARATLKISPQAVEDARAEAAAMNAAFPGAMVAARPDIEHGLVLPDENDLHVLASAIAGHADAILTFNASDFPGHVLAAEGISRRDPDGFLWEMFSHHPDAVAAAVEGVRAEASALNGAPVSARTMLKPLRLGRLARAMAAEGRLDLG